MNMQKILFPLVIAVFMTLGPACMEGEAADVVGTYSTSYRSALIVRGFGTERDDGQGVMELENDGTWSFLDDAAGFSGTYATRNRGRRVVLFLSLSPAGIQELIGLLSTWLQSAAAGRGEELTDLSISLRWIKFTSLHTNKRSGLPGKVKLYVHGVVSGNLNGLYFSRKLRFKSKIRFLERL
jgi:hypothetical protein